MSLIAGNGKNQNNLIPKDSAFPQSLTKFIDEW